MGYQEDYLTPTNPNATMHDLVDAAPPPNSFLINTDGRPLEYHIRREALKRAIQTYVTHQSTNTIIRRANRFESYLKAEIND